MPPGSPRPRSWATSATIPSSIDLIAVPDPLTGGTRLIAANNNGVWTGVLGSNGQLLQNIGDVTNDQRGVDVG